MSPRLRAVLHYLAVFAFAVGAGVVVLGEKLWVFGPWLLLFLGLFFGFLASAPVWPRRP